MKFYKGDYPQSALALAAGIGFAWGMIIAASARWFGWVQC